MERRIFVILWLTLVGPAGAADGPKAPPVKEPETSGRSAATSEG